MINAKSYEELQETIVELVLKNRQLEKALDNACDYLSDTELILINQNNKLRRLTKEEWKEELYG